LKIFSFFSVKFTQKFTISYLDKAFQYDYDKTNEKMYGFQEYAVQRNPWHLKKKVMRKRSTLWELAERTIHRLKDCLRKKGGR